MNTSFNIKIAEKVIGIKPLYGEISRLCREYIVDENADFTVEITADDIEFERIKSEKEDIKEGIPVRVFSDEYLETLSVYRKIAERMLEWDTFLFHGSVIAVDGEAFLFTAKSGTGKSTHTKLWREFFGERAVMINDDKPLIRLDGEKAFAYGTPWDGKHHLSTNICVPLKAVCILERDTENHIEMIKKSEAYNMLIQQIYRPNNPAGLMKTLKLADRFAETVKLFRLGCNMNIEAAKVAYEGMKG